MRYNSVNAEGSKLKIRPCQNRSIYRRGLEIYQPTIGFLSRANTHYLKLLSDLLKKKRNTAVTGDCGSNTHTGNDGILTSNTKGGTKTNAEEYYTKEYISNLRDDIKVMDENEKDKASQRANLIEQRMFEITLSSIETLKHATAIELHKSQNEMKKRLRKYRDRQREIVRNKQNVNQDPIEELLARQMKSKAKARRKTRPKTCPPGVRHSDNSPRNKSVSPGSPRGRNGVSSRKSTGLQIRLFGESSSESEDEDSDTNLEIDGSFMIDQQKSKIDLRPKTALDIARRGISLEQLANNGRLGPAMRQIRYFDEDELKDRGHFYEHLVQKRIQAEKNKLQNLDGEVAKFCGSETIQTMTNKMQSKRAFFTRNTDWSDSVNNKLRNQKVPDAKGGELGRQGNVRPSTSVGFRKPPRANFSTFRKPSYIAT